MSLHWEVMARRRLVLAGLRLWAQGSLTDTAAVELLASCARGRFADTTCPWVHPCRRPGWFWLDPEQLLDHDDSWLTPDQRRVLVLVAALLGGEPTTRSRLVPAPQVAGRWAA